MGQDAPLSLIGPGPVPPNEVAKRAEIWLQTLNEEGEAKLLVISLEHDTKLRRVQLARHAGAALANLIASVVHSDSPEKFSGHQH